jgi:hypothetical protein
MYCAFLSDGRECVYHIGDRIRPEHHVRELEIITPTILWIQADGHELEAIQRLFILSGGQYSIPMPKTSVARWYGDIARTIHINMIDHTGAWKCLNLLIFRRLSS